ncbi:MAG TPA: FG-GAP repeat protein, partial [Chitinophagaceae bacterium]|nr:FG-GAP repeat protein [Chitinophagaceae bacterium]
ATGDLDGDGTADLVVGNSFEGGNALRPGDPIPDIDITLKTAAGKEIKIPVDEKGQFMINDLKQGNYQFIITQKVFIDDNSFVMLDDNKDSSGSTKARNNNTVRSNRTDNALLNNDNNNDVNNIAIDEGGSSKPKVKNTTRDIGPIKWMAPEAMKKNINTSEDNLKNMLASLDALEQQLDADQNNAKAIINTSRSNIKSQRIAIADLEQTLDNLQMMEKDAAMKELEQKRNESDLQFLKLQDSLHKLGVQYSTISNVLKARHDIAMNAIRNMK